MWDVWKSRVIAFLRWSERYTRTDMLYLTKGGFWLLVGQGIQIFAGLVVSVAFANFVPKDVFGTYQFVMSMAVVLGAFTLTGMNTAVARAVARGSEGALRAGFRAQMAWNLGIAAAGTALAAYYYFNHNFTLAFSFLAIGALLPFVGAFSLTQSYLTGKQLFRESAVFGIGRRLLPVACITVAVFLTHDVLTLVVVYFASNAVSSGLLYAAVVRRYRLSVSEESGMIGYAKHLSFLRTFSEISTQADKVLLFHFSGGAAVAAYALAQLPITHIQGVFKLLPSLTFPKMSTTDLGLLQKTLPHKVRLFLVSALAIVALYILLAPFLFSLLFPAYAESVLLSQALALSLLASPRSLYGQALTAHQKKRELYIMNISNNILRVLLLLAFIPLWGLWGAVGAVLLAQLYLTAATRYLFWAAKTPKASDVT